MPTRPYIKLYTLYVMYDSYSFDFVSATTSTYSQPLLPLEKPGPQEAKAPGIGVPNLGEALKNSAKPSEDAAAEFFVSGKTGSSTTIRGVFCLALNYSSPCANMS